MFYQDTNPALWQGLLALQARVRDYVAMLGLELLLDEAEGYAYLRQKPSRGHQFEAPPRLVHRRALSYPVSLLLALLRKKLAGSMPRAATRALVLTSEQIVELVRACSGLPIPRTEARIPRSH